MDSKDCKICAGAGLIRIDDLNTRQCVCSLARSLMIHLGPEIGGAKPLTDSPLFIRGEKPGDPVEYDATTQNLFLKGRWIDVISHFKFALCFKGLNFRTRVTTDEKLKSIFVGNESYKAVMRSKREDMDTYNGLADYVTEPHLLIIRLGFLGYKNIAMAGILKEALLHREVQRKATWLLEVPTSIFGPGHFSYNDDVGTYIDENFTIFDLSRYDGSEPIEAPHGVDMPDEALGLGAEHDPEAVKAMNAHMPKPRFQVDEDAIDAGMGQKPKYGGKPKYKPKRYPKKGGGNGGGSLAGSFGDT